MHHISWFLSNLRNLNSQNLKISSFLFLVKCVEYLFLKRNFLKSSILLCWIYEFCKISWNLRFLKKIMQFIWRKFFFLVRIQLGILLISIFLIPGSEVTERFENLIWEFNWRTFFPNPWLLIFIHKHFCLIGINWGLTFLYLQQ